MIVRENKAMGRSVGMVDVRDVQRESRGVNMIDAIDALTAWAASIVIL